MPVSYPAYKGSGPLIHSVGSDPWPSNLYISTADLPHIHVNSTDILIITFQYLSDKSSTPEGHWPDWLNYVPFETSTNPDADVFPNNIGFHMMGPGGVIWQDLVGSQERTGMMCLVGRVQDLPFNLQPCTFDYEPVPAPITLNRYWRAQIHVFTNSSRNIDGRYVVSDRGDPFMAFFGNPFEVVGSDQPNAYVSIGAMTENTTDEPGGFYDAHDMTEVLHQAYGISGSTLRGGGLAIAIRETREPGPFTYRAAQWVKPTTGGHSTGITLAFGLLGIEEADDTGLHKAGLYIGRVLTDFQQGSVG